MPYTEHEGQDTMANRIETHPATGFDSPLQLWIAIWQRQLVHGAQCGSAS